jgi:hypothetical protein
MCGSWDHGLRGHGSRGRCMEREGWEVRVLWIEVFIVFLGFDLASWVPGPGGGAGWWEEDMIVHRWIKRRGRGWIGTRSKADSRAP